MKIKVVSQNRKFDWEGDDGFNATVSTAYVRARPINRDREPHTAGSRARGFIVDVNSRTTLRELFRAIAPASGNHVTPEFKLRHYPPSGDALSIRCGFSMQRRYKVPT